MIFSIPQDPVLALAAPIYQQRISIPKSLRLVAMIPDVRLASEV